MLTIFHRIQRKKQELTPKLAEIYQFPHDLFRNQQLSFLLPRQLHQEWLFSLRIAQKFKCSTRRERSSKVIWKPNLNCWLQQSPLVIKHGGKSAAIFCGKAISTNATLKSPLSAANDQLIRWHAPTPQKPHEKYLILFYLTTKKHHPLYIEHPLNGPKYV